LSLEDTKGTFDGKDYTGWKTANFACDQQYLGPNTVHKISLQFELNKNLRRRRRLGDGKTKGDPGTFGFSLSTGNCVRPKDGDGDCGEEPAKKQKKDDSKPTDKKDGGKADAGGESFGVFVAILSLFAL